MTTKHTIFPRQCYVSDSHVSNDPQSTFMHQTCHNQAMLTDPDMRKYDGNAAIKCPACPGYMVPLNSFEITHSNEGPSLEADFWEYMLWGWWAFIYNFIFGSLDYNRRKNKLADLKQKVLPKFPTSLVCSQCLHVTRRK